MAGIVWAAYKIFETFGSRPIHFCNIPTKLGEFTSKENAEAFKKEWEKRKEESYNKGSPRVDSDLYEIVVKAILIDPTVDEVKDMIDDIEFKPNEYGF